MSRKTPKRFCDDFHCQLKWSCAKAFVRQEAYWAMEWDDTRGFFKGPRNRFGCSEYEQDKPKEWLAKLLYPTTAGLATPFEFPENYTGLKVVK